MMMASKGRAFLCDLLVKTGPVTSDHPPATPLSSPSESRPIHCLEDTTQVSHVEDVVETWRRTETNSARRQKRTKERRGLSKTTSRSESVWHESKREEVQCRFNMVQSSQATVELRLKIGYIIYHRIS